MDELNTNIDKIIKRSATNAPAVGSLTKALVGSEVRLARVIYAKYIGHGRIEMGIEFIPDAPPVLRLAA